MAGAFDDLKIEAIEAMAKIQANKPQKPDRGSDIVMRIAGPKSLANYVDELTDAEYQMEDDYYD